MSRVEKALKLVPKEKPVLHTYRPITPIPKRSLSIDLSDKSIGDREHSSRREQPMTFDEVARHSNVQVAKKFTEGKLDTLDSGSNKASRKNVTGIAVGR